VGRWGGGEVGRWGGGEVGLIDVPLLTPTMPALHTSPCWGQKNRGSSIAWPAAIKSVDPHSRRSQTSVNTLVGGSL
jgi:hypothetical protein